MSLESVLAAQTLCPPPLLPGCFSVQNVAPQPDGDSSKVKVKVRINVHGIFSVSSASLIEKQKGEAEDMQIDSEPMVQNDGRAEDQVRLLVFCKSNISCKAWICVTVFLANSLLPTC